MIKNFMSFIKENLEGEVNPDEIVKFQLHKNFLEFFDKLKDYKVAQLLLTLKDGVPRKYLAKYPVNFIKVEDNGSNLSYLKSRYFTEDDLWGTTRRTKMKVTKAIKDIFNDVYINDNIKQTDVEAFMAKLATLKEDTGVKVLEWRGEELLRAYNYTEECHPDFGYTCANFFQKKNRWGGHAEPRLSEYDIYVKNPDNCGVCVVVEDGKVIFRRSFQQGPNLLTKGIFEKGKMATVYGNGYGIGGRGAKNDLLVKNYLQDKYNAFENQFSTGGFLISLETRFTYYCPFDLMYVNFEHNLLTDDYGRLLEPYRSYNWTNTYHASCPDKFVQLRLKEE